MLWRSRDHKEPSPVPTNNDASTSTPQGSVEDVTSSHDHGGDPASTALAEDPSDSTAIDDLLPPTPDVPIVEANDNHDLEARISDAGTAGTADTTGPVDTVIVDPITADAVDQAIVDPVTADAVDLDAVSAEPVVDHAADGHVPESLVAPTAIAEPVVDNEMPAVSPTPVARRRSSSGPATVLAIANQKGGVGKTTTTVSLSAALAEAGVRVLVIDLDPQGNATTGLGVRAGADDATSYHVLVDEALIEDSVVPSVVEGLDLLPASLDLAGAEIELVPAFSREARLKKAIDKVRQTYDVVLIDCPPSLGLITINALVAADRALVPIQCEYYALEGLGQLMRTVELVSNNLNDQLALGGIAMTMYDARTKLSQQVVDEVRQHFGDLVFQTVIPRTVRLSEAPSFGQPITQFDPSSKGARSYRRLADEVAARFDLLSELPKTSGSALDRLLGASAARTDGNEAIAVSEAIEASFDEGEGPQDAPEDGFVTPAAAAHEEPSVVLTQVPPTAMSTPDGNDRQNGAWT